jgi:GntR family transcriptional regulator, transcriptional repressor for pyruvate dehydrogenase complex
VPADEPTPARAWRSVLESIESDLTAGRLRPGDRLPPERELAVTLEVGRSSVREALRVLEVLGLIRTGTGSGPTSGAFIVAAPGGGLATVLRLQVAATGFPVDDVVQTRLILEPAALEALAAVADRDIDAARAVMDAMAADDLSAAEFLALDAQLHLALAEASGNVVVASMMEGLRSAIESYVVAAASTLDDWEATAARLRSEHRSIVAAVDAGDGPAARTLVHDHIARYYAEAGLASPRGGTAW